MENKLFQTAGLVIISNDPKMKVGDRNRTTQSPDGGDGRYRWRKPCR